ncbi:hypothetical protein MAQ5080_01461 [Marinomonas aquimarina]|uniref:DUF3465 domain-containing protein n=1 Tax=Marinomonas aquimarina TaxID=295068 RepID=A0A1A8TA10_9GAMM|nr:DUF3465 domain-containing protein [Marinomonas aquimarina]SBS29649.1 hypothetical protein MAQ5080_01461 [Marinomonas aquimarina]
MKYCLALLLVLFGLSAPVFADDVRLQQAYAAQQSDLQIQGSGTVIKVLKDDTKGSMHQRFILQLDSGQTLLVAHNIDLAPRIPTLKVGDTVEFYGEYEWNKKGGVMHWTHHDPRGRHPHGWLKHNGRTYQ